MQSRLPQKLTVSFEQVFFVRSASKEPWLVQVTSDTALTRVLVGRVVSRLAHGQVEHGVRVGTRLGTGQHQRRQLDALLLDVVQIHVVRGGEQKGLDAFAFHTVYIQTVHVEVIIRTLHREAMVCLHQHTTFRC